MIFSGPVLVQWMRWIPPAFTIMGSCTTFMGFASLLWTVRLFLPSHMSNRLEMSLYSSYQLLVAFWFQTWSCVEFRYYGDILPEESENVLYLSNHQCTMDWVVVELLCLKQGNRGGRARYVLKDTIKYLPLYGWMLKERGGIFVKRKRGTDQNKFIRSLKHLAKTYIPSWLILFPEGTRFNPRNRAIIERSHEYARSLGIPEFENLLTPKTTGFELSLQHIRNHFDAVYDVTIYYEGYRYGDDLGRSPAPDMFSFFSGSCRRVHIHIRRIPVDNLPWETEEIRAWLYDAFCKKDRLLDDVIRTGTYSSAPSLPYLLPLHSTLPPTILYSTILIGALSHRYGRWWWVGSFVGFSLIGLAKMTLSSSSN